MSSAFSQGPSVDDEGHQATAKADAARPASHSEEERRFVLDLHALTVEGWPLTARRALLFIVSCCLPVAANRARHLAFATADELARWVRGEKEWKERKRGGAGGGGGGAVAPARSIGHVAEPSLVSQWEEEFLSGLGQLLSLDQDAVTASASAHTHNNSSSTISEHDSHCSTRTLTLTATPLPCAAPVLVRVLPVMGVVEDALPFVSSLPRVDTFDGRVVSCLLVLHDSLVRCGGYDARVRVLLRRMTRLLGVRWEWWVSQESRYARALKHAVDAKQQQDGAAAESTSSRAMRYLKIGSAVVIGGVAIGLTGGLLAAPLLGAGLAGIGLTSAGATVTALVASTSGVVLVSSIFGIAGGSLAGYKMNRRVAGLSEFRFVKLGQVMESMEVLVGINGWLAAESDYSTTWQCLQQAAPLAELYVLRWETPALLTWGAALQSLTLTALAKGWAIGKIKTLLIGSLLAAVAWPMWLVRASDVIDNSYSVIVDRTEKAAQELANVLETRVQGHRPISLVGYGMGARVIFLCLEELFKRRQARLAADKRSVVAAQHRTGEGEGQSQERTVSSTEPTPSTSTQGEASDAQSSAAPAHLLSTHVDASREQQVLTVKGYQSLPSTSLLLNADGLVEDVYLLGLPVELDLSRWMRARSMVSGRLLNGYCTDDWLLRFCFGAANITNAISGLRPVTVEMQQSSSVEAKEEDTRDLISLQARSEQRRQQAKQQQHIDTAKVQQKDQQQPHAPSSSSAAPPSAAAVGGDELDEGETEGRGQLHAALVRDGDVDGLGIENVNLTDIVNGHTRYPTTLTDSLHAIRFRP